MDSNRGGSGLAPDPAQLKYDPNGLIPAIVQDAHTRVVLMVAYMDREALNRTIRDRKAWFWSRSRREYWLKGGTSGNYLSVHTIYYDCDADTLLLKVSPQGDGVACHTGRYSCFHNLLFGEEPSGWQGLQVLDRSPRVGGSFTDSVAASPPEGRPDPACKGGKSSSGVEK